MESNSAQTYTVPSFGGLTFVFPGLSLPLKGMYSKNRFISENTNQRENYFNTLKHWTVWKRTVWERRMGQCEGRGWLLAGSALKCPVIITGLRLYIHYCTRDSVGEDENGTV